MHLPAFRVTTVAIVAFLTSPPTDSRAEFVAPNLPDTIYEICESNIGIPLDPSLQQLRGFAPIRGETINVQTNPHDTTTLINFHRLFYSGLEIYASIPASGRVLIGYIETKNANYEIPFGIELGISQTSDVERIFGQAHELQSDSSRWSYYCGETDTISFEFDGGRLISVRWHYYVD